MGTRNSSIGASDKGFVHCRPSFSFHTKLQIQGLGWKFGDVATSSWEVVH